MQRVLERGKTSTVENYVQAYCMEDAIDKVKNEIKKHGKIIEDLGYINIVEVDGERAMIELEAEEVD